MGRPSTSRGRGWRTRGACGRPSSWRPSWPGAVSRSENRNCKPQRHRGAEENTENNLQVFFLCAFLRVLVPLWFAVLYVTGPLQSAEPVHQVEVPVEVELLARAVGDQHRLNFED